MRNFLEWVAQMATLGAIVAVGLIIAGAGAKVCWLCIKLGWEFAK